MTRTLWNPETKRGHLKAIAYSQYFVSVHDELDKHKREVLSCETFNDAVKFMDAINPYLDAFREHVSNESPETMASMSATYDAIPERRWRGAAITIAFRRFEDK